MLKDDSIRCRAIMRSWRLVAELSHHLIEPLSQSLRASRRHYRSGLAHYSSRIRQPQYYARHTARHRFRDHVGRTSRVGEGAIGVHRVVGVGRLAPLAVIEETASMILLSLNASSQAKLSRRMNRALADAGDRFG